MRKSSFFVLGALVLLFVVTAWCGGGNERPIYAAELAVVPTATRSVKPTVTPRPTSTGAAATTSVQPDGALIWLRVHFVSEDASGTWRDLYTVVQWQDAQGLWHDVEGWCGPLDAAVKEGRKVWWLSEDLRGAGPFRWQVYQSVSGALLAESASFDLPAVDHQLTVEVVVP